MNKIVWYFLIDSIEQIEHSWMDDLIQLHSTPLPVFLSMEEQILKYGHHLPKVAPCQILRK